MQNPSGARSGLPGSLDVRSRENVLRVFRTILSRTSRYRPTFESLAVEVGMTTKQLASEWLSMEALASDSLMPVRVDVEPRIFALSRIERLEYFLREVDHSFDDPSYQSALTKVVRWAPEDESAALALSSARLASQRELIRLVGPVSEDNYVQIVGPIYFNRLHGNGPISKKLMRMVVDRGMTLLGLDSEVGR
ncbi:hypothetical protein BH09ACT1_BH09ACT1_15520 [soil metagenome]